MSYDLLNVRTFSEDIAFSVEPKIVPLKSYIIRDYLEVLLLAFERLTSCMRANSDK